MLVCYHSASNTLPSCSVADWRGSTDVSIEEVYFAQQGGACGFLRKCGLNNCYSAKATFLLTLTIANTMWLQ